MKNHVAQLYGNQAYPGMSHSVAHPSAMAASALLGGLRTPHLETARILEIGCAQGHHITPIAYQWPKAKLRAIDLSSVAISYAKNVVSEMGMNHIEFQAADLRDWHADGQEYDYIIAHGMFSWVDDDCKAALLRICRESLSPSGVAMVSYNTLPGWALRQSLSQMTRALQKTSLANGSAMTALDHLDRALEGRTDEYGKYLQFVVRDAAKKGEEILQFDDLAPINDPFYLTQFVQLGQNYGLRYIGESDMGMDHELFLTNGAMELLPALGTDPLFLQQAQDLLSGRTFRTSLLCRDDAVISAPNLEEISTLCVVPAAELALTGEPICDQIVEALRNYTSCSVRLHRLQEMFPQIHLKLMWGCVSRLIATGAVRLVSDERFPSPSLPAYPAIRSFNQIYLRDSSIVIDGLHQPCKLSQTDREFLLRCNGSLSLEELMQLVPDSQRKGFEALMEHMNQRGIFF